MEISNRALAVVGIAVVVGVFAYRIREARAVAFDGINQTTVDNSSAPNGVSPSSLNTPPAQSRRSSTGGVNRTFANDSPMPPDNSNFIPSGATAAQDDSGLSPDQAQADNSQNGDQSQYRNQVQPSQPQLQADNGDSAADDLANGPDVDINISEDGRSGLPGELNDQQVFDRMMSWMDSDEREAFVVMWIGLGPTDRTDLIDSMRSSMGGY